MKPIRFSSRRSSGRKVSLANKVRDAFTLIELLVSMAILSLLLLLLAQLLDQVQQAWRYSEGRVSQFREARVAFDIITKNLSQASLNTYWDYEYDEDSFSLRGVETGRFYRPGTKVRVTIVSANVESREIDLYFADE